MAEVGIVLKLFETSQRFPLRMNLRRPNALPLLGWRDLILCGDIRQLPPPSGKQPFWGTRTFQTLFEVFRLHEDRRHERDLGMQGIKELLAWGGCQPEHHTAVEEDWPVDESLFDFVVDG